MAKTQRIKPDINPQNQGNEPGIVINNIVVGQLERGRQDVQTWFTNLKSAERVLNPNRRYLLDTYLDIDIDLHLASVKGKRIRALKNVPFVWQGLENDLIKDNLSAPWFYDFLETCGESLFWGYTVNEFKLGGSGLIEESVMIPLQNVKPHKKVITKYMWGDEATGFPYTEAPYNKYILEIGKPTYLGMYARIAPYVLLKRANLSDFARFNEMFGMPLRWYEYDPHDPGSRVEVEKSAQTKGSAAYIIVPKGTAVNYLESKQSGTQAFTDFHRLLNDEISIGVLGQTLTTTNDGKGSNALGKVHMQVEAEIAMEDRLFIELLVNYSFKKNILLQHGYPLKDVKGAFNLTEEVSMENKLKMWLDMVDRGLPIAEEDFYNEFGVPLPVSRPVVVKQASPPAPPSSSDPANPDTDPSDDDPDTDLSRKNVTKLVAQLYNAQCKHRHTPVSLQLSYTSELNNLIEQLIQDLFQKKIEPGQVDGRLRELYLKEFNVAVFKSIGNADAEFRNALLDDVKVFSQFKEYQFLRAATDALVDETGALRTFSAFRDEVLKLNSQYNIDWLQTEYNHAIGSARMAKKWQDIVKNKETLPLLQYVTAGDSRVRQSHKKLDKIILPMDHPFWDTHYPPNDWNCRCTVKQLAEGEQSILRMDELPQLKPEFSTNTGKARTIFPKNHPYYNAREEDAGAAANNFGLK